MSKLLFYITSMKYWGQIRGAERGPFLFGSHRISCYKRDLALPLWGAPPPKPPCVRIVSLGFVNPERHGCLLGLVNSKNFNLGNSLYIKISRICPRICPQYFILVSILARLVMQRFNSLHNLHYHGRQSI